MAESFNLRARVGRDSGCRSRRCSTGCFNPRARVGRDLPGSQGPGGVPGVSIHAPAWGATTQCLHVLFSLPRFNPRARVGRDCVCFCRTDCATQFQSTRPRGARPALEAGDPGRDGFNPRARVGRDTSGTGRHVGDAGVSIHAPAWGATHPVAPAARVLARFQSTRPRGARPDYRMRLYDKGWVSIHAPAWGATAREAMSLDALAAFQSTRPRGARHVVQEGHLTLPEVSIHAPAWGAT